jgi:O-antigen ligase
MDRLDPRLAVSGLDPRAAGAESDPRSTKEGLDLRAARARLTPLLAEPLLAIAAGLAVAGVVSAEAWPAIAAVLGVATLAMAFTRPFLGTLALLAYGFVLGFVARSTPAPIGLGVDAILAVLATRLLVDLQRFKDWERLRTPMTWPIAGIGAYAVLEIFNPLAPSLVFGVYGIRVLAGYALLHLVTAYYYREPQQLRWLVGTFVGLATFAAAYGIRQSRWNFTDAEYRWFMNGGIETHFIEGHLRIWSIFSDAGTCSFALAAAVLLLAAQAEGRPRPAWAYTALAAVAGLLAYALLITYTRAGYVALAVAVATYPAWTRRLRAALLVVALGTVGVIGLQAAALAGNYSAQRIMSSTDSDDGSADIRRDYIERSIPVILGAPMGIGSGTTGRRGAELAGSANQEGQSKGGGAIGVGTPTDHYNFKLALETGLPGLGLFLWLQGALGIGLARGLARWPPGPERSYLLGFALVATAYAVGAIAQNLYDNPPNNLFFWIGSGVAMRIAAAAPARQFCHMAESMSQ